MIKIPKKFFKSQIFLFLILLIFLFFLLSPIIKNIHKKNQINKEILAIQNNINKLEKNKSELNNMIDYLNSEQFIEEQAKLKMGLRKKGEKVAVIQGLDKNKTDNINDSINKEPKTSSEKFAYNIKSWFNYFFSLN